MGDVNIRIADDEDPKEEEKERKMGATYSYSGDSEREEKFLDIELEKRKWKNRRQMAWVSLVSMNILTLILLFAPIPDERIKILAEPLIWFFLACTSIIGAYMGFTTWASRK